MLLGLSKIIDCPGASVPFSVSLDLSDLRYGTSYPVSEPVDAEGVIRNTAGVLMMTGLIRTCLHGTCDRCAADFTRDVEIPINVVLVTELADEDNEDVENKITALESIIKYIDDLTNELLINMNSKSNKDIDSLYEDMEDLIDSVKDYD